MPATPFLGEIDVFGFNFAPRGYAQCNGQIIPISQNTALFAIVGTTYGGNGTSTFGLPNLKDQIAVNAGQGPGLSSYVLGEQTGTATVTLLSSEIASHTHQAVAGDNVAFAGETAGPKSDGTSYWGRERGGAYAATSNTQLHPLTIGLAGGGQPHANGQPVLVVNVCIAIQGVFPARN
jgi:microcystin-dependent protein